MSEPVTNAEIEDVLSSIRRLVSEDSRKSVRQTTAEAPVQMPDRLVLTPSLRVAVEDVEEAAAETEAPEIHDDADADEDVATAEPEADPEEWHDAAESAEEAEEAAPWTDPDATLYDAAGFEAEEDDTDDAEPEEAWAPEAEAAPEKDSEEAGSEEAGSGEAASEEADSEQADEELDSADDSVEHWAEDEESGDPVEEPGLANAVEALSAAMGDAEEAEWEPSEDETTDLDVPDAEPLEWLDDDGDDQAAAADPDIVEVADEAEDTDADLFSADEAILDEATLRELVTDIVREELQGALGERITRNVRKLVRREINRALSVQELE